ncbi:MAG: glycosyltransferase 87 family protein [Patescibacteria group bacterium]
MVNNLISFKKLENRFPYIFLFIISVSLLSALVLIYRYYHHSFFIEASDLGQFLSGAQIINSGEGSLLYDLNTQLNYQNKLTFPLIRSGVLPYRSLPFVSLIYIPFIGTNYYSSYYAFLIFNIILLIIFAYLVSSFLFKGNHFFFILFLCFSYIPFTQMLFGGQVSMFMVFSLFLTYLFLKKDHIVVSGAFAALLLIKPQYVIFVPFIFLYTSKKLHFAFGFFMSCVVLFLISVYMSGLDAVLYYPHYIFLTEEIIYYSKPASLVTLQHSLNLLLGNKNYVFILNSVLVLLVYLMVWISRKKLNIEELFVIASVFTLLLSLHAYSYDLMLWLFPSLLLLKLNYLPSTKPSFSSLIKFNKTTLLFLFIYMFAVFWMALPTFSILFTSIFFSYLLLSGKNHAISL